MSEQINYVNMLPNEPPEGLVSWLLSQGKFQKEYLIYKAGLEYVPLEDRGRRAVEVTCTSCQQTFYADKVNAGGCGHSCAPAPFGWFNPLTMEPVISGRQTTCPCCGVSAETKHVGTMPGGITQNVWTAVVSRLPVEPAGPYPLTPPAAASNEEGQRDRLLVTDWMTTRSINKQGRNSFGTQLYTAWVVEEKKIARIMGYHKYFSTVIMHPRAPEQKKTFVDVFGEAETIFPWDPAVLEGTTAENSKLDLYQAAGGKRLIAYLGLWQRKPAVENLLMQGCGKLVKELLDEEMGTHSYQRPKGYPQMKPINWKEKRPAKMLGMTREELRIFQAKRWEKKQYDMIRWARENDLEPRFPEGVEQLARIGKYDCANIMSEQPKEQFWRILRYLDKKGRSYTTLRDYWNMAKKLKMDLEDSQVCWPKDLKTAHDRAVGRYNLQKDQLTAESFAARTEELSWLRWEHDGLLIRPCESETELRREGRELHHCVATYAQRHADGRTAILLIRRVEEPDKPFFTLELDEEKLKVEQNRGLRNCSRTVEVKAFEEAWLEWAQAQKQKKVRVRVA